MVFQKTYLKRFGSVLILCSLFTVMICADVLEQKRMKTIEFFGMRSNSSDVEMMKLAQDLIFSYISEMPDVTVIDKRKTVFSPDMLADNSETYAFYAELYENDQKWEFSLFIIQGETGKLRMQTKVYDNYYRVLLEVRPLLQALFASNYVTGKVNPSKVIDVVPDNSVPNVPVSSGDARDIKKTDEPIYQSIPITSFEILAGNWKSGNYIEKVVILKGGRGFIIFTNGASMNILLNLTKGLMTATQTGPSNYKYFPELPEEQARDAARLAPPISWRMELSSDIRVLFGEKISYIPEYVGDTAVSVREVQHGSVWMR